jgi:uncharacterized membrane protein
MLGVVIGAVIVLLVGAFALSIVGIGITDEAIKTFKENN